MTEPKRKRFYVVEVDAEAADALRLLSSVFIQVVLGFIPWSVADRKLQEGEELTAPGVRIWCEERIPVTPEQLDAMLGKIADEPEDIN